MLTKTCTVSIDFIQKFVVDDAGLQRLEAGLGRFGISLQEFGKVLTKTNTMGIDFIQKFVVDDTGRQNLAIGCAHFGLTLLQFGIILCKSGFSSRFIQEYIVNSSNWHCVQRLDKFTNSDLSSESHTRQGGIEPTQTSSLAILSKPQSSRLTELSQMEHSNRPNWDELATELDSLCHEWWRTRLSDTDPDISNNIIRLLLLTRPDPTTGRFLRYGQQRSKLLDQARIVMGGSQHSESSAAHVVDTHRRAGSKRKACPEADETAEALAQTTTALAAGRVMVESLESTIEDAIQNDRSKLPALGRLILSMRTLMNALIAAREHSHVTTMVSVSYQIMQLQNEEVNNLIECSGKS